MKSATGWILITLILIAVITGLSLVWKGYGFLLGAVLAVFFFVGLNRFYKWKSKRLLQSLLPGESLAAEGLVSESTYDETPAILLVGNTGQYRIHIADSRGSQEVQSVQPALSRHSNVYDQKQYLVLQTDKGVVHFAPRKSLVAAQQPAHAQEVLEAMLVQGVRKS